MRKLFMRGENFLFRHGPIRLSKNRKYLEHLDGTPFFWLADTWWYGATDRTSMSVFKSLVKKRKSQGFSAVQIVVGIPPEIDAKNAKKIGGNPFKNDLSLDKEYFEEVDKKIKYLADNGLVPVIFGGWGHHIDRVGVEGIKRLWHEIVGRYSSYPVIFCLAGEVDIEPRNVRRAWNRIKNIFSKSNKPKFLKKRIKEWLRAGDYISSIDPYKRPITAHVSRKTTALDLLGKKSWLSINSIQSGHSKDSVSFMVNSIKKSVAIKAPIINMEPWYEGILGNFGEYEQRLAFWMCILSGAKGHSYGAHGIWQMSKTGENFMRHWGESNWEEALEFKGAKQLGLARKFLEKYEWWKFEPDFDRVSPHWTEDNVYLPVAARIEDKDIFIYVPRVKEVRGIWVKGLKRKTFYKASFLSPKSMRIIDCFKFKGKEYIIPIEKTNTEDLLVVISRR